MWIFNGSSSSGGAFVGLFLILALMVPASSSRSATAQAAPSCADGASSFTTPAADGWEEIRLPFSRVAGYAVDPYDPKIIYAHDGSVLVRSTDAGCSFDLVLDPTTQLAAGVDYLGITLLEIPGSPKARGRVYVALSTRSGPRVLMSEDSGSTWADASAGLLPSGVPQQLIFSEADPDVPYMLVRTVVDLTNVNSGNSVHSTSLYRWTQAVQKWELRYTSRPVFRDPQEDVAPRVPRPDLTSIALEPSGIWAASVDGLFFSVDAGASWNRVPEVKDSLHLVDVSHLGRDLPRILAFSSSRPLVYWSDDGGRSWRTEETLGAKAISVAQDADDVLISLESKAARVVKHVGSSRWASLAAADRPLFYDLTMDRASPQSVYAHSTDALWRRRASLATVAVDPELVDEANDDYVSGCGFGSASDGDLGLPEASGITTLQPTDTRLILAPGESRVVRYELDIPTAAVPLDVFFLVDTSGSMLPYICNVRESLKKVVATLGPTMPDIRFGVAEYNDWPASNRNASDPFCNTAYRRQREIGPPDRALTEAFARISRTCGGNEPVAMALEQAVRGLGSSVYGIPPGMDAQFRDDAVKVLLHVADECFCFYLGEDKAPKEGPPGPTYEQVIESMLEEDVFHVGLSAGEATFGMQDLSRGTGAIATTRFACYEDGYGMLEAGDPLVCPLHPESEGEGGAWSFASALTGMLFDLEDRNPVALVPVAGRDVVASIEPSVYPNVDLLEPQSLDFEVTYECSSDDVGESFSVELEARAKGFLDAATAEVTCLPVAPPPLTEPLVGALLLGTGPPPLPPNPHTQTNPGPQPGAQQQAQSQAQQQAQGQAQAAAVPQRQEQPQLALVHAARALKEQVAGQHAMVRSLPGRPDPLAAAKFGLAMGALSLMIIYGLATVTVRKAFARNPS